MPDILIRGMEMPHDCFECEIGHLESTGLRCNFSHYSPKLDGRPQDCPLNELPPHGDLIDRNTIVAYFRMCENKFGSDRHFDEEVTVHDWIEDGIVYSLLRAPAVIPSNKEKTE